MLYLRALLYLLTAAFQSWFLKRLFPIFFTSSATDRTLSTWRWKYNGVLVEKHGWCLMKTTNISGFLLWLWTSFPLVMTNSLFRTQTEVWQQRYRSSQAVSEQLYFKAKSKLGTSPRVCLVTPFLCFRCLLFHPHPGSWYWNLYWSSRLTNIHFPQMPMWPFNSGLQSSLMLSAKFTRVLEDQRRHWYLHL